MFYTHGTLDRADHLRRDDGELDRLRHQPTTRLIPVWRGTVLAVTDEVDWQPRLASLRFDADVPAAAPIWLGLVDGVGHFAINCSALDDSEIGTVATQATTLDGKSLQAEFSDLRKIGPLLPANEGAILAFARGMHYWHENTRFCSRCSHALGSTQGGHVLVCSNSDCAHSEFPRTDPAVIMLVTDSADDERCLLGRSPAWPEGVFSTLAGFVEPGESLEQAVQREVFEESGIRTDDVRYVASQPWPFPRSIMLGFEARALDSEITIDPNELADAAWFTRTELRAFGNWGDGSFARQLPRTDSIARFLIDRWMDAAATSP